MTIDEARAKLETAAVAYAEAIIALDKLAPVQLVFDRCGDLEAAARAYYNATHPGADA